VTRCRRVRRRCTRRLAQPQITPRDAGFQIPPWGAWFQCEPWGAWFQCEPWGAWFQCVLACVPTSSADDVGPTATHNATAAINTPIRLSGLLPIIIRPVPARNLQRSRSGIWRQHYAAAMTSI
jgi:hypothetical protein